MLHVHLPGKLPAGLNPLGCWLILIGCLVGTALAGHALGDRAEDGEPTPQGLLEASPMQAFGSVDNPVQSVEEVDAERAWKRVRPRLKTATPGGIGPIQLALVLARPRGLRTQIQSVAAGERRRLVLVTIDDRGYLDDVQDGQRTRLWLQRGQAQGSPWRPVRILTASRVWSAGGQCYYTTSAGQSRPEAAP